MGEWKKVISETDDAQIWINTKEPRLIIRKLKGEESKKFEIQVLNENGKLLKLLAKCDNLRTAMKWVEELGADKVIECVDKIEK